MNFNPAFLPGGLALVAGFLIFCWPAILSYIVAGYLLITGLLGFYLQQSIQISIGAICLGLLVFIFPRAVSWLLGLYLLVLTLTHFALSATSLTVVVIAILLVVWTQAVPRLVGALLAMSGISLLLFHAYGF